MLSLTIPEKPIWSLSKPTPSLVQCRLSSEPPIRHDFLFQPSACLFLFNSCSPLIQREKSSIVKTKQNPEQIQTNQIKENVLKHFNTHMMLWDGFMSKMVILFLAIYLMLFFCWFFQPPRKSEWKYFTDVTIPGKSLSTEIQVYAENSKCLACGFLFFLHQRDYVGLRSVHMEAARDTGTVTKTKGDLSYQCTHICKYLFLQMII